MFVNAAMIRHLIRTKRNIYLIDVAVVTIFICLQCIDIVSFAKSHRNRDRKVCTLSFTLLKVSKHGNDMRYMCFAGVLVDV